MITQLQLTIIIIIIIIIKYKLRSIQLPDTHRKCIDVFIQLVQKSNALDNHVVNTIHIEFNFRSGVTVPQAKLCCSWRLGCESLNQFMEMVPYTCTQFVRYENIFSCPQLLWHGNKNLTVNMAFTTNIQTKPSLLRSQKMLVESLKNSIPKDSWQNSVLTTQDFVWQNTKICLKIKTNTCVTDEILSFLFLHTAYQTYIYGYFFWQRMSKTI